MFAVFANGCDLHIKKESDGTLFYELCCDCDVIESGYTKTVNLELYSLCEDYIDYVLMYHISDEETRSSKIKQKIYDECLWNCIACCDGLRCVKCDKYIDVYSELGKQLYNERYDEQRKTLIEVKNKWEEKFNEYGGED